MVNFPKLGDPSIVPQETIALPYPLILVSPKLYMSPYNPYITPTSPLKVPKMVLIDPRAEAAKERRAAKEAAHRGRLPKMSRSDPQPGFRV